MCCSLCFGGGGGGEGFERRFSQKRRSEEGGTIIAPARSSAAAHQDRAGRPQPATPLPGRDVFSWPRDKTKPLSLAVLSTKRAFLQRSLRSRRRAEPALHRPRPRAPPERTGRSETPPRRRLGGGRSGQREVLPAAPCPPPAGRWRKRSRSGLPPCRTLGGGRRGESPGPAASSPAAITGAPWRSGAQCCTSWWWASTTRKAAR